MEKRKQKEEESMQILPLNQLELEGVQEDRLTKSQRKREI
jgi:hypothetical protein